jgi:carbamate kinase
VSAAGLPGAARPQAGPAPAAGEVTVACFGGNALLPRGSRGTVAEQLAAARGACAPLAARLRDGARLLVVFGNGPQVGQELLRSHAARAEVPPAPLDACVAATQGTMGYVLELALRAEIAAAGLETPVASVLTLVRVDGGDPAFAAPDKPVGPFCGPEEAERMRRDRGWAMVEEGGAWRRAVPSPRPLELVDAASVGTLLAAGHVVVAGGGGGIPVVRRQDGTLAGVEGVVDKDRTAALLARAVGAAELIDLTTVDFVYRGWASPRAVPLRRLTAAEARALHAAGEFPPGSMGPKIEAALDFLACGGRLVLVTALPRLAEALRGEVGTRIVP